MKTWSMLVAMLVLGMFVSLAVADDAAPAGKKAFGKITKIDGVNITIQGKKDGATPVTFATTDTTTVTIKGDATKKVSDLAVDMMVAVTLSDDGKTATAIVSPIPMKKAKGN